MNKPRLIIVATAVFTAFALGILVITAFTPLHRLIFAIVSADGPVSSVERINLDQTTANYLVTGDGNNLTSYSSVEQSHLADVRVRMVALALISGLLGFCLVMSRVVSNEWRLARNAAFISFVVVGIAFEPLFILMHELIFPDGNWYLPSSQYVITQVYPLGFFIACWLLIGLIAMGLLAGMAHFNKRVQ